jgi:hypothetical protein
MTKTKNNNKKKKKMLMLMNMKKKKMMLMMMMTTIIMIMIMIMMIMTVASVDQRPGWGEHVKNPWSLWCSLHGWKNHGKKNDLPASHGCCNPFRSMILPAINFHL